VLTSQSMTSQVRCRRPWDNDRQVLAAIARELLRMACRTQQDGGGSVALCVEASRQNACLVENPGVAQRPAARLD